MDVLVSKWAHTRLAPRAASGPRRRILLLLRSSPQRPSSSPRWQPGVPGTSTRPGAIAGAVMRALGCGLDVRSSVRGVGLRLVVVVYVLSARPGRRRPESSQATSTGACGVHQTASRRPPYRPIRTPQHHLDRAHTGDRPHTHCSSFSHPCFLFCRHRTARGPERLQPESGRCASSWQDAPDDQRPPPPSPASRGRLPVGAVARRRESCSCGSTHRVLATVAGA